MKTIPALIATALVLALILTPLVAHAAGSITFSSPASGASYSGSQGYTISGVITPAPGVSDSVFLTVKNPSGQTVDASSRPVSPSTGGFNYSTAVGGSSNWVTGTYTIAGTDSYGATGSTTFTYTASTSKLTASGLHVTVEAMTPALPGQSVEVTATAYWDNGSLAAVSNFPIAHYVNPGLTTETQLGTSTKIHQGAYMWMVALGSSAASGLYLIHIQANASGNLAFGTGAFTVNSALAPNNAAMQKDLAGNFTALTSALSALSTAVGTANTGISNIQTTLGNVNTAVQSLSGLSDQLKSATSGISSTQTYVLVVAVLAAITLVLELAILVRKLS